MPEVQRADPHSAGAGQNRAVQTGVRQDLGHVRSTGQRPPAKRSFGRRQGEPAETTGEGMRSRTTNGRINAVFIRGSVTFRIFADSLPVNRAKRICFVEN